MSNLPAGTTHEQLDRGHETPSQERARELMEEIHEDWDSLWHEIVAAEQSRESNQTMPERMEEVLKEVRERYT